MPAAIQLLLRVQTSAHLEIPRSLHPSYFAERSHRSEGGTHGPGEIVLFEQVCSAVLLIKIHSLVNRIINLSATVR